MLREETDLLCSLTHFECGSSHQDHKELQLSVLNIKNPLPSFPQHPETMWQQVPGGWDIWLCSFTQCSLSCTLFSASLQADFKDKEPMRVLGYSFWRVNLAQLGDTEAEVRLSLKNSLKGDSIKALSPWGAQDRVPQGHNQCLLFWL